ncbi:MAG TPA: LLM class flavin-dependent oxidoreductase [Alphaproteobacteria bacterium]|nr:LLM class flavin-dependent oxidoreductase [Alphaproteobacteria bacterium]HBF98352.1 LLM class flavin-dependent oxidoreductase [Alphaproteobacteria bacterium]
MQNRMRNGIFMAPFHPVDEDPTMALARDLELVEWLDRLGYDEAWIGEHHSAGFEIIASPELFIAAAAERTRHIRLGTGVVSLPYHNPLMTANRIIQLDHMTRGRVMFGAGPGLLPSDASMLGIDPSTQRDRMAEALDVILRLFAGETVSETTEWYTLNEARLHLLPYSDPYPEVAVASSITPSGGRLAGKYDLGMLCVAATQAGGFDALGENWKIANEIAQETRGKPMDPRRLRLVGPVHIAETREKARENVQFGIHKWLDYFSRINPTSSAQVDNRGGDPVDTMIASGSAVIGTPDDAVAQIRRLQDKQGDFGCFLQLAHNWADFDSTKKSYELWQRYVMPQLTGANRNRDISLEWTTEHGERLMGGAMKAAMEMFEKHQKEQAAKAKEEAS